MQYFIGIVPSKEYIRKVREFRQQWSRHSINEVVEPHITLKAQGGLTEDRRWLKKVREICDDFEPFHLSLDQPRFFGDDILYLSVKSQPLYLLHERMVREISPTDEIIKSYFELDDFVPHLTLGKTTYGLTKLELQDMAKLAENELTPFPTFEVRFVRVYQEVEENQYRKYMDITLNGG
ncbi:2'-5' RNA ligase family protein [Halobacillus mangrovi]|uniref:2'-5' RNA ligase family protein n=1 Tax=Halobacillus mangrovi TaxID=402384 RepID=UPI0018DE7A82|nr:2'-5' RNA ligase family protein [Halobacillus mangrovi]